MTNAASICPSPESVISNQVKQAVRHATNQTSWKNSTQSKWELIAWLVRKPRDRFPKPMPVEAAVQVYLIFSNWMKIETWRINRASVSLGEFFFHLHFKVEWANDQWNSWFYSTMPRFYPATGIFLSSLPLCFESLCSFQLFHNHIPTLLMIQPTIV